MPQKEIWGLRIEPDPVIHKQMVDRSLVAEEVKARTKTIPQTKTIYYRATVSRLKKGDNKEGVFFVTNPALRQFLEKNPLPEETVLGNIDVNIESQSKKILIDYYYPYLYVHHIGQIFGKQSNALEEFGLASAIDYQLLSYCAKKFPGFLIKTDNPTQHRRQQLSHQKLPENDWVPVETAFRKVRDYVANGMRKIRGKKPVGRIRQTMQRSIRKIRSAAK